MQEAHAEAFTSAFKANKRAGDVPSGTYDHVYIDVNNVLHVAAHHTKNEDAFFKKLFALLDLNMRRTRPQYTVVLALDGPAPIAKTITQRRRRIRLSSGEKVPLSEDPPRLLKIGLTPGSALALKIDRALEYYAATRLLSRNALPKGLLFEISGTRVPGEGEVKILRSMKTRVRNPKFRGHSHLIVSEDSDALLLAMTAAPADVFVLSSKLVFSVRAFNASLEKDLPEGMSDAQMRGARRDFVALAVMMGNDYLPGSRFGVKYSWRAYTRLRGAAVAPDWKAEADVFRKGKNRNRNDSSNDSGAVGGDAEADVRTVDYASNVRWGEYRETALFPVPSEADFGGSQGARRGTRRNFFGVSSAAVYEEGKLAFRHPPPVNWPMLRDFATVLSDPEYVKWQVSGGLRPRADVQRAVNAAAASAGAGVDAFQASLSLGMAPEHSMDGREQRERDEDLAPDELREGSFSTIPGVAGVVRAMLDPKRSARRAYEYVHGVGWVLEMYYAGACLDYGYHFQYSSKEHNAGIAATIEVGGAGGKTENGARKLARAADDAATAAATAAVAAAAAAAAATAARVADSKCAANASAIGDHPKAKPPHMGGRNTTPPPAVDLADFQTLPDTYDPSLDPLRDRNRASIAFLNRYPITPLAYSLAVIPRGGRTMLARGVRPLVDAGSPVHHLFCDDYCVTCIKHRITAGPLERVIQQEAAGNGGGGGRGRGGGRGGGRGRGRRGRGRGDARGAEAVRTRDLSRKFAGGDATIREAAAAGGDVAREVLKKLNRRHLEHLSRAPQHAQDKPPPPLNDLEGAVARVSLDNGLNEDEETLRTLGDQPVLIWHHKSRDPPEVDLTLNDALTSEEDIPRWAARVTPSGCRPVGGQMHEIRRYDGDAEPVVAAWAAGGEAPPVAGGPGGGGRPKGPRRVKPGGRAQGRDRGAGKPADARANARANARAKRGRGGKESGGEKDAANGNGGGGEANGARAPKPAARGASRRSARPARAQTREPSVSPPLSPPSPTVTDDDRASQPRGGGRASAFPSVAGGVPARRSRFASGLGPAARPRREKCVGRRGAAPLAAARGPAFAFC